jgi:hypothetical protein
VRHLPDVLSAAAETGEIADPLVVHPNPADNSMGSYLPLTAPHRFAKTYLAP